MERAGPTLCSSHQSVGISQLWRSRLRGMGSQPHTRLLSPEHQCQEEEPPLCLAVKISWNSNWVREKATEVPGTFQTRKS